MTLQTAAYQSTAMRQHADASKLCVCLCEIAQVSSAAEIPGVLLLLLPIQAPPINRTCNIVLQLSKQYQVQDTTTPPGACKTNHYKRAVRAAKCALSGTYI